MSYSQSYDNEGNSSGGGGCMLTLLALGLLLYGLMTMAGDSTRTTTTTDTRSGLLSGNQAELFSRNQVNLWSDVQNCYGDYSCMTVITTTATNNTSTNVDGERNVVYAMDGTLLCPNPDKPNEWGDVAAWCEAIGVQP